MQLRSAYVDAIRSEIEVIMTEARRMGTLPEAKLALAQLLHEAIQSDPTTENSILTAAAASIMGRLEIDPDLRQTRVA